MSARKWLRATWLPGAILLALLIGVAVRYGESQRFAELIQKAEPIWLLIAAILQIATYLCTALIFKFGLRRAGVPARLRSLVPLGLVKLFIDQVVPTGGVGGTVLLVRGLQRRGVPTYVSTAVVVVSLLGFYMAYATGIALCLWVLWTRSRVHTALLTFLSIVALVTAVIPVTLVWLTRGGTYNVPHWIRRLPALNPVLEAIENAPRETLHDRKLHAVAAALQFAVFVLDAATLRAMFLALGVEVEPQIAFAGFMLAEVAATVSFLPGGVGPFEAGSVATLRLLRVPFEASVAATLLLRGFTLWLPMLPGLWLARKEMAKEEKEGERGTKSR